MNPNIFPQIKICGLTSVDLAMQCADLGAHAIGCVFFPKSPRHLEDAAARDICRAVNPQVQTVGVFVNESIETILQKVSDCGISMVQLHGQESPDLVQRLREKGIAVIKTLFVDRAPDLSAAPLYEASAFLVECGGGPLPGGNAIAWDWKAARSFAEKYPCILAGGLSPENVTSAIDSGRPRAVDVSSGVESEPGVKSIEKVRRFIENITALNLRGESESTTSIFPVRAIR